MALKEWRLHQLFELFPDITRGTRRVLRCVAPAHGHGKWVKDVESKRETADVKLRALPAVGFSVRSVEAWPEMVPPEAAEALERALLQGILEGTIQCDDPPWACRLECVGVALSSGAGETGLRVAARLAVEDLVHHGEWQAVGSPGDHVA